VTELDLLDRIGRLVTSMYWTWPTAAFFASILLMLALMTILELIWPTAERKGLLPMPTTRGDRLFIGLLGGAWIHLGWLALLALPLWGASIVALLWFALVMRFG
jgi:predicted small integral membrane protein